MSTALAIAGVTAVLRDLLNDGLINHKISGALGSTVVVTIQPPDKLASSDGSEGLALNIFMHQVTPNIGWRNDRLPSLDATGKQRLSNAPLALDLHYLLSAYGGGLEAEILLGYAMQLLHETPVLARAAIEKALKPALPVSADLPPALQALQDSGLEKQIELIKITPEYLSTDEMSKLWTATQSSIRPSAAYAVSTVLIQSEQPTVSPLPVLTIGPVDPVTHRERGVIVEPGLVPSLPMVEEIRIPRGQTVALPGDAIELIGYHLEGTERKILLKSDRFKLAESLDATGPAEPTRIRFTLPALPADRFPVGFYRLSVSLKRPGETDARSTNELSLTLACDIAGLPKDVKPDNNGKASFDLDFAPALRQGQTATLLLGQREIAPQPSALPTTKLSFAIDKAPVESHLARLRIDGIDSPIIDREAKPPVFRTQRINIK